MNHIVIMWAPINYFLAIAIVLECYQLPLSCAPHPIFLESIWIENYFKQLNIIRFSGVNLIVRNLKLIPHCRQELGMQIWVNLGDF